jgi:hypothetical protein
MFKRKKIMDTLKQRRTGIDLSWYRETEAEIKQLSGKDRFGNYWSAEASYDHCTEMYQPRMTNKFCLFDGSWWNIAARTPDEAIDVLIADGKYKP